MYISNMNGANYLLTLTSIPDGYEVFEERLQISGVSFRKREARQFVQSGSTDIYLERDIGNAYDENAIAIYGRVKKLFSTKNSQLGFVPKEIAKQIVESGFENKVLPRLYKTYAGSAGYIEIEFQILGPKGERFDYDPPITGGAESYVDYVPRIKQLRLLRKNEEAIVLLIECIDWIESESRDSGGGVAPWYYEQLAIIYRQQKDRDAEIAILERFMLQKHAPGVTPAKLAKRLKKLIN